MNEVKTDSARAAIQQSMSSKSVESQKKTPSDILRGIVESMKPQIKSALPKSFSEERFIRLAVTAIRTNPKLASIAISNKLSFLGALMQSVQMGLEPNTPLGEAYLIPYGSEIQFQVGYKGLIALAYRTGEYQYIDAQAVCPSDEFTYQYGTESSLKHVPAGLSNETPIFYYAVWKLKNGGHGFAVMSKDQISAHRDRTSKSASGKSSPWHTDFDAMAQKTVLKRALRYAPKSIELSRLIESDETVKSELSDDMFEVQSIDVDFSEVEND